MYNGPSQKRTSTGELLGLSNVSDNAPLRRHSGPIASNMEYFVGDVHEGELSLLCGLEGEKIQKKLRMPLARLGYSFFG
jgi:hypothetical protein